MKKVLDHGFVELIDHMPQNLDKAIVDEPVLVTKRVQRRHGRSWSYPLSYRNWHTSPLELVVFKFRIKAPIYIAPMA